MPNVLFAMEEVTEVAVVMDGADAPDIIWGANHRTDHAVAIAGDA